MSFSNSKPWWQSLTVQSGASAIVAGVASSVFKLGVEPVDISSLFAEVSAIVTGALSIFGRLRATKRIR